MLAVLLVAASACASGGPAGTPSPEEEVSFRLLREGQNAGFCIEGPDAALARAPEEWAAVGERQAGCQPGDDGDLPAVAWDTEIGVAVWWGTRPCLGYGVQTEQVGRERDVVTIAASESEPQGVCATALGALESFYALDREAIAGATTLRYVLDGAEVGRTAV